MVEYEMVRFHSFFFLLRRHLLTYTDQEIVTNPSGNPILRALFGTITLTNSGASDIQRTLEWLYALSASPFNERHERSMDIANKAPGTGKWFLEDPTFTSWLNSPGTRMWCHAIRQYPSFL